jgi:hypothetical protein
MIQFICIYSYSHTLHNFLYDHNIMEFFYLSLVIHFLLNIKQQLKKYFIIVILTLFINFEFLKRLKYSIIIFYPVLDTSLNILSLNN